MRVETAAAMRAGKNTPRTQSGRAEPHGAVMRVETAAAMRAGKNTPRTQSAAPVKIIDGRIDSGDIAAFRRLVRGSRGRLGLRIRPCSGAGNAA